ncbi:PREDICTED: uncharacterized protein C14orf79 homolog [Odobenus rosmarus divergens]|uniref:Uncharacterized protein C14orf79 homolog n=1 Tax=Odobenus rosmarus divergens TaxID=9708 RepID=A0A2U3VLG7_ODORO|nr:PREDICTED: uncharacterized protein C14orf79 homolog [Odobenus rosmarus divergens]
MQGQRQRGAGPGQTPPPSRCRSDLAEEAGDVSLCPASKDSGASKAPGGRRGAGAECLSGGGEGFSTCPAGGPDPGEHNSAWGEFEGFQESSAKSEQFSPNFELPERPPHPRRQSVASTQKERGSRQPPQGGPGVPGAAGSSPCEVFLQQTLRLRLSVRTPTLTSSMRSVRTPTLTSSMRSVRTPTLTSLSVRTPTLTSSMRSVRTPTLTSSMRSVRTPTLTSSMRSVRTPTLTSSPLLLPTYKDVFRFVFQEVPVQQATEGVSPLDCILELPGCESGQQLCSESRKLWRALQNTNSTSASRCLWSESRCQENLFLVLGIDAAQKNLSGDLGHILESSDLQEPEELGVPTFRLQPCRALIQTKLSGTSGGRQGSLLACSLFLKTPLHRNGQYLTVPWKKKIFNPRNLKMTLFNSDVC